MNKTLISRLVIGAIATLAAGSVMAGQIQASNTLVAREVITADDQQITSPSVSYRLAGDVNATTQNSTFQMQVTLGLTAEWDTSVVVADTRIVVSDQNGVIKTQGTDYSVVGKGYSADKKTMWFTVTALSPNPVITQPIITLNGVGAGTGAKIIKLKTVVGDLPTDFLANKCVDQMTLPVSVKHFTGLTSFTSQAGIAGNGSEDDSARPVAANSATLIVFPTNLLPVMTTSTAGLTIAAGGNKTFAYTGGLPTTGGGVSTSAWAATTAGAVVGTTSLVANLGTVSLKQNASGYDASLATTDVYALGKGAIPMSVATPASAVVNGLIEAQKVVIDVAATNGFVENGNLSLRALPAPAAVGAEPAVACSGAVIGTATPITAANKNNPSISITLSSAADLLAAFGTTGVVPAQVCYTAPGTAFIPNSQFSATATIVKAPLGVAGTAEQNNACKGPLFALGGGLKIDVRNYASSQETSGYKSVIRLINNSDTSSADVWGQIIHQNGSFGGYGLLTTLAPRQILNMTADQIDAKLLTAPSATALADNGTVAPAFSAQGAPRLRITSQTGASLRVQNYLFNAQTGQILEGSNSQAVDFEGTTSRAPVSDGQYISQDANSGLNGK